MKFLLKESILAFLFVPSFLLASFDLTDQFGIRARGMGKAGRALVTTNDAIHQNPAGMSQYARFNFDLDYVYRMDNPVHLVGVTLVDSTTTPFAGGIEFQMGIDPEATKESLSYFGTMALSLPLVDDLLFIGASGKYAYMPSTLNEQIDVSRFGMDAGLLLRLANRLSLGATGYNLIPTDSKRLPLSIGFGAAFNVGGDEAMSGSLPSAYRGVTIAFDWLLRDVTSANGVESQLSAGIESLLFDYIPVRVGYSYALKPNEHELSFGLGYVQDNFALEGFYEQNLTATAKRGLGFAMRMFL